MGMADVDRLVIDALLLDAVEGIEGLASCLTLVYTELHALTTPLASTTLVLEVIEDLGWWCGRLEAAVSPDTQNALAGIKSSDGS